MLEAIVQRIPPPTGDPAAPLKALVFDSFYDPYQGVVTYVRVIDGRVAPGTKILLMSNGRTFEVQQVGVFSPQMVQVDELTAGQVGFLTAGIKRVADSRIGETITEAQNPTATPLPGFREAKPMVFSGLYPVEDTEYQALRDALEKLRLNDSAFNFEPESSIALGFGFRCGFLGLLHMEIIQERLEREFGLALIATAPSVRYRIDTVQGETIEIDNPAKLPPVGDVVAMSEPYVRGSIFVPTEFMGAIYKLAQEARGEHRSVEHIGKRVHLTLRLPARRDHRRLLRPAEVPVARLRVVRLRLPRVPALRSSSSWTSCSTAIRWTRCRSSSTGTRRTSGARCWPRSSRASSRARSSRS